MADQLATPQDLASLLQLDYTALTAAQQATMTMLIELATAKVQRAAGGQRILDATTTAVLDINPWHTDRHLTLPQLPVRSVSSVLLDGTAITDWHLRRQRLWRTTGWITRTTQPTQAAVTYTHGHPAGSQGLQLARAMTLSLSQVGYGNPGGAKSERIDDYQVSYGEADARMQLTDHMRQAIAAEYGTASHVTTTAED